MAPPVSVMKAVLYMSEIKSLRPARRKFQTEHGNFVSENAIRKWYSNFETTKKRKTARTTEVTETRP